MELGDVTRTDGSLMVEFLADPVDELLIRVIIFVEDGLEHVDDKAEACHFCGLVSCKLFVGINFVLDIFESVERDFERVNFFFS